MMAVLARRPKLTTLQKLRIVARYCRCPGLEEKRRPCGAPLGELASIEFDHIGARALTGDDGEDNFRPLCPNCHDVKTFGGRGGTSRITTADGDIAKIAKVRRLTKQQEEARAGWWQRTLARNGRSRSGRRGRFRRERGVMDEIGRLRDWCVRMAHIEDGDEISAGRLHLEQPLDAMGARRPPQPGGRMTRPDRRFIRLVIAIMLASVPVVMAVFFVLAWWRGM